MTSRYYHYVIFRSEDGKSTPIAACLTEETAGLYLKRIAVKDPRHAGHWQSFDGAKLTVVAVPSITGIIEDD